jgi:glycosyltransferase involved in cell wall biosynthesis
MTALRTSPRQALAERLRAVVDAVGWQVGDTPGQLLLAVAELLEAGTPGALWLTLAVLRSRFPDVAHIEDAARSIRLNGAEALVRQEGDAMIRSFADGDVAVVQVLADAIVVDVNHTAGADSMSGIQRVVREIAPRWQALGRPVFVGWSDGYRTLRPLTAAERDRMGLTGPGPNRSTRIVPWRGAYLGPELTAEPPRARALQGLGSFGRTPLNFIVHDCIPVTSGGTVAAGMSSNYLRYLAAARSAHRVSVTSEASANELLGWRRMARAAGFQGPEIVQHELPVEAAASTVEALTEARLRFCVPGSPLVLVVGSHEPRKNHLAVLHAAELLWREGLRFNLVLVGSSAWQAQRFDARVDELQRAGRQVVSSTGLPDELLWAAYRLARFVVFPSLNEGYGLPIAEALSVGTPVVTSEFGSMRQIVSPRGEPCGGLLVDPRDDHAIADGMRRLLVDEELWQRLHTEARVDGRRTWDTYAAETWAYLTGPGAQTSATSPS